MIGDRATAAEASATGLALASSVPLTVSPSGHGGALVLGTRDGLAALAALIAEALDGGVGRAVVVGGSVEVVMVGARAFEEVAA